MQCVSALKKINTLMALIISFISYVLQLWLKQPKLLNLTQRLVLT